MELENLAKWRRCLTPQALAWWLVNRVALLTGAPRVAALWVSERGPYWRMEPAVQCWGRFRDANLYAGPWPIVAHPPCGPWGKYRHNCHQRREDGIRAMALVERWGGVVEQPVGSQLFALHAGGGRMERIMQGAWGFPSPKPTLLYWRV